MMINSCMNIVLPIEIAYGASGGAEYSTTIIKNFSGREQRNINWNKSRRKYNILPSKLTKEAAIKLVEFFHKVKGRAFSFLFSDPLDNKILNASYPLDEEDKIKLIHSKINHKTLEINYKNVKLKLNRDYKIKNNIIYFINIKHPDKVTVSYEFYMKVRFDIDYLAINYDNFNLYSVPMIPLIEVMDA